MPRAISDMVTVAGSPALTIQRPTVRKSRWRESPEKAIPPEDGSGGRTDYGSSLIEHKPGGHSRQGTPGYEIAGAGRYDRGVAPRHGDADHQQDGYGPEHQDSGGDGSMAGGPHRPYPGIGADAGSRQITERRYDGGAHKQGSYDK